MKCQATNKFSFYLYESAFTEKLLRHSRRLKVVLNCLRIGATSTYGAVISQHGRLMVDRSQATALASHSVTHSLCVLCVQPCVDNNETETSA